MPDRIDVHDTPWREVVIACRKCGKKLGNKGFGADGDRTLPQALRAELRQAGRRREVRVVEAKCLGLCPKRGVAVVLTRTPGEILEVPAGTPAVAVAARLHPATT